MAVRPRRGEYAGLSADRRDVAVVRAAALAPGQFRDSTLVDSVPSADYFGGSLRIRNAWGILRANQHRSAVLRRCRQPNFGAASRASSFEGRHSKNPPSWASLSLQHQQLNGIKRVGATL